MKPMASAIMITIVSSWNIFITTIRKLIKIMKKTKIIKVLIWMKKNKIKMMMRASYPKRKMTSRMMIKKMTWTMTRTMRRKLRIIITTIIGPPGRILMEENKL